jgi:hypothetical protein
MNVGQVTTLLKSRPNISCDIGYFRDAQKVVVFRKLLPAVSDISQSINQVAGNSPTGSYFVDVYHKNGSSWKHKNESYTFNQEEIKMNSGNLSGFGGISATQAPLPVGDHFSQYVISEKQQRIDELKEQVSDLKTSLRNAEDLNKRLKEEKYDLERDLKFKDREHELQNLEAEVTQSNGLGGFVDKVSANPQLLAMLGSFLGKPVPAQLGQPPATFEVAASNVSPAHQDMINQLTDWMEKQTEEAAAKMFSAFLYLSNKQGALNQLLSQIQNG